jgi:two-component system chemotaxis response regulator CheY
MKILVVDDETTSRELLRVILAPHGQVDTAEDGIAALRAFNLAAEREPYDLICLDIMLPKMDGQEVLRNIRTIEQQRGILGGMGGVKIIMISALGDFDSVNRAFASRCTSYVTKPITREKIERELERLQLTGGAGGPRP